MRLEEAPDAIAELLVVEHDGIERPALLGGMGADELDEVVVEALLVLGLTTVDGQLVVLGHVSVEDDLKDGVVLPEETLHDDWGRRNTVVGRTARPVGPIAGAHGHGEEEALVKVLVLEDALNGFQRNRGGSPTAADGAATLLSHSFGGSRGGHGNAARRGLAHRCRCDHSLGTGSRRLGIAETRQLGAIRWRDGVGTSRQRRANGQRRLEPLVKLVLGDGGSCLGDGLRRLEVGRIPKVGTRTDGNRRMSRRPSDRHELILALPALLNVVDRGDLWRQAEGGRTEALQMGRGSGIADVEILEVGTPLADVSVGSGPCTLHVAKRRSPEIAAAAWSWKGRGPNLLVVGRGGTEGRVRTGTGSREGSKDIWRSTDLLLTEGSSPRIVIERRDPRILDRCNAAIRRGTGVGPIAKERGGAAAPALQVLILRGVGSRPGLRQDGRDGTDGIGLLLG